MMRRRTIALLLVASTTLVVGCVPYQTYKQTQQELERAKAANIDLTKKYNDVFARLMMGEGGTVDESALQAQLVELQRQNDELRRKNQLLAFSKKDAEAAGVPMEGGGLYLGEETLFAEGSAALKTSAYPVLDRIVGILQSDYRDEMVVIEGHTDNQPLDKTKKLWEYNMRLGYSRAQAVFEYFLDHGISESRMKIESYSFNKPTDPATANTKDGRARNRRVVVRRGGLQF